MATTDDARGEARRPGFLPTVVQTYAVQIGVSVLSLGNVLIVARALGPSGRGQVAFLTVIAFLTSSLSTLGVEESNVNLAGAEPQLRRTLASNSVILSALLGCVGAAVVTTLVVAAPDVGGSANRALLALVLVSLPVLVLNVYLRFLIQGEYGFAVTNTAWFLPAFINVSVNAVLALAGALTVGAAVGTWIAGQTIATAILVWYVARRSGGFGRPSLALARRTLGFGVRSHIGRIMLIANYRLDQWILGAIAGARELGFYSVATALAEALFLLPTALSAVQRPDLVRASRADAVRQASWIFRGALLITILSAVVLVLVSHFVIITLFGEEFRDSVDDLRVLAGGAFGIVALKQLGSTLTARQKPTLASIAIGIAFASTVVLDVILIPSHGGIGAAIASTLSYTFGGVLIVIIFTRALKGRLNDLLPRVSDLVEFARRIRGAAARSRATRADRSDEPPQPIG